MDLPTGVLAYRLLKNADLAEDKLQLAKGTITSFSYDYMKKQQKAIYGGSSQESIVTPVKVEAIYKVKGYRWYGKDGPSSSFGGGKRRGRFNRGDQQNTGWRNPSSDTRKMNPLNLYGSVSQCGIWQKYFIRPKNVLTINLVSQIKIK